MLHHMFRALLVSAVLLPGVHGATAPVSAGPESRSPVELRPVELRPVDGQMREGRVGLSARAGVRTLQTGQVSMVAATWSGASSPVVEVSTPRGAGWSRWRTLPVLDDGPTRGSGESTGRRGTDLVWIKEATRMRVRTSGAVPADLALVLVDTTGDDVRSAPRTRAAPTRAAPRPRIRPRSQWGAKEKWRGSDPVHNRRMRQVHIHHTANSNDYSRDDVPGMLRGIYRYHTKTLGWSDIGYNVLVDRFGRAWVGRYDGLRHRVRGAHTLGFNHNSTGMAVIGNFSAQRPRPAVVRTLARIAAWQLDRHGRKALGRVRMTSYGSDRFAAGARVRLPVILGHRRTNQTACPGDELMKLLPTIRQKAQRRIDRF